MSRPSDGRRFRTTRVAVLVGTMLWSGCKQNGGGGGADARADATFPPNKLGLAVLSSEFMGGVAAHGSVVAEERLFVAAGRGGLGIFAIGAGGGLSELGRLALDGNCTNVAVSGKTALVACGASGVHAVDVSDPAKPRLAKTVAYDQGVSRDAVDVKIEGDVGFVLDRSLGLYLLRPVSHPESVSAYAQTSPATLSLDAGSGLAVEPGRIYVSDSSKGLHILSYTIPESPHLEQVVPLSGGARSVVVAGGKAYCATHQLGLAVIELGGKPAKTAFLDTPKDAFHAAVNGGQAYIADAGSAGPRLVVAKIDSPAGLSALALLPLGGEPRHVTLHKSFAFVSASSGGLFVVDISIPNQPAVLNQKHGAASAQALARHETLILVAAGKAGLYLVDTSTPRSPVVRGVYLPDHGDVQDVAVSGGLAYVMTGVPGMHILDLADPAHPALVGTYLDGPKLGARIVVADKTAYLASEIGTGPGLDIVDVTNPKAPVRKGVLWSEASGSSLAVGKGFAYLGRYVIDLADPAAPKVATTLSDTPGALHLSGKYLYGAGRMSGDLVVYDLSDPARPAGPTQFNQNRLQAVSGIVVADQRLYALAGGVGDGLPGLEVLDLDRLWSLMPGALLSSVPTPGKRRGLLHDAGRQLSFVADGEAGLTIIGVP